MQTVHYVIAVIGALLTGLLAASHMLPPSIGLWIIVGATILTPVLTTLGLTSNSAVTQGSASATAIAGDILAAATTPATPVAPPAPVTVNVHQPPAASPPAPAPAAPPAAEVKS